jgi:hypothetical protein
MWLMSTGEALAFLAVVAVLTALRWRPDVSAPATQQAEQDGRIHIEKINAPFLYQERATPAEYSAGIERGWLVLHEAERM